MNNNRKVESMKKKLMMMAAALLVGAVSSYGTVVAAWDFGTSYPAVTAGWTQFGFGDGVSSTVGGLTLAMGSIVNGTNVNAANFKIPTGWQTNGVPPLLLAGANEMNDGFDLAGSAGTQSFTLSGLTVGQQYTLQFIGVIQMTNTTAGLTRNITLTVNDAGVTNTVILINTNIPVANAYANNVSGYSQRLAFTPANASVALTFNEVQSGTKCVAGLVVDTSAVATYTLTVNGGTGGGVYTNGAQVAIAANAPAYGYTFNQWTGDTLYVDNVTSPNATVTMSTNAVTLTATYKFADGFYPLTVNNGTGGGVYTEGAQVAITATNAPSGRTFHWIGNTQYVDNVTSVTATVTMPAGAVTLTAAYPTIPLPGTVVAAWDFGSTRVGAVPTGWTTWSSADLTNNNLPSTVGALTLTYSSTNVVAPFASIGAAQIDATGVWAYVNAPLLDLDTSLTAQDVYEDFLTSLSTAKQAKLTLSGLTDGRTYQIQFVSVFTPFSPAQVQLVKQDGVSVDTINSASAGPTNENRVIYSDYYNFTATNGDTDVAFSFDGSTTGNSGKNGLAGMIVSEVNLPDHYTLTITGGTGGGSYSNGEVVVIAADAPAPGLTFDVWTGDTQYVTGVSSSNTMVTMPAQAVALTATYKSAAVTLTASAGPNGTVTPASTNVVPGNSADFVVTASNYYRIASLTTNGTAVTGVTFDNSSASYNFTWSNVQAAGTLAVTFTAQLANDPAGTPYWWLAGYGLTNYNADAVADQDADGLKTWQEYIAGTDPTSAASTLKVAQTNRNTVTWSPVAGRLYSVYWSTNLVQGFSNLASGITYPQGSFTNTSPNAKVNHYQVRVQLQ